MVRSFYRFLSVAAAALVLMPSAADASQIDFRGVGHAAAVSISGVRTGSFLAGELDWQWIGTTPDGFPQSFYSYCVDVSQNLTDPQTVTVRSSEGFTNGVTFGGSKAAWLFNTYAAGIRSNTTASTANIQAAALQVAIWEAMYDTTANLGGGNFILNTTGSIRTQAQTYLTSLYTAGTSAYDSVATVLEVVSPNRGQDQITSKVSEPSTLVLMGMAFLMFAKRARRQRSSSPDEA
jgi:hypothetical protein